MSAPTIRAYARAAVVIPAHNEQARLPTCLRSVVTAALCAPIPIAIVVVLDTTRDDSAKLAGHYGPDVHFVSIDVGNVGAARAVGFNYARSLCSDATECWYATTDADSRVDPDWLVHQLVVCLRFDLVEGGASALNLGDDVVGGGLPDEWLWVVVPVLRPRGDCGGEVGDAGESATAQAFVGEFLEPAFDQVQPGTRSRRVVQVPAAAVLVREPLGDFRSGVGRQVVQHDVHTQAAWNAGVDLLEEPQHVGACVAFAQIGQHLARGDVHRREQVDRAVSLVVMGHCSGAAGLHRQRRLSAVQGLALGLLVEAEHHCARRRIHIQPNDVDEFLLEPRVVADLERLDLPRLEVVVGPDLGHGVFADPDPGSQGTSAPMRRPVGGGLLVSKPQQ